MYVIYMFNLHIKFKKLCSLRRISTRIFKRDIENWLRIGDREVPLRPRGFGVNRFYFCPAKRPRSSLAPTVHIRQQFPTRTPPLSPLSTQIPSIGIVISSTSGETPGGCYEEPSGLIPALQESLLHSSTLKILWKPSLLIIR